MIVLRFCAEGAFRSDRHRTQGIQVCRQCPNVTAGDGGISLALTGSEVLPI